LGLECWSEASLWDVVVLCWLKAAPVMRNSLWLWFRGQALKSATAESREPFGES
jgi:hypothetical protein